MLVFYTLCELFRISTHRWKSVGTEVSNGKILTKENLDSQPPRTPPLLETPRGRKMGFGPIFPCFGHFSLDLFETPVTVTPQQEISKTLDSSKIPLKYFTFTFQERAFTFRERAFTLGMIGVFGFFWNFIFCCWGVLGLRGSGGPRRGLRKYLNFSSRFPGETTINFSAEGPKAICSRSTGSQSKKFPWSILPIAGHLVA